MVKQKDNFNQMYHAIIICTDRFTNKHGINKKTPRAPPRLMEMLALEIRDFTISQGGWSTAIYLKRQKRCTGFPNSKCSNPRTTQITAKCIHSCERKPVGDMFLKMV